MLESGLQFQFAFFWVDTKQNHFAGSGIVGMNGWTLDEVMQLCSVGASEVLQVEGSVQVVRHLAHDILIKHPWSLLKVKIKLKIFKDENT